jgi:hypothetical protein
VDKKYHESADMNKIFFSGEIRPGKTQTKPKLFGLMDKERFVGVYPSRERMHGRANSTK